MPFKSSARGAYGPQGQKVIKGPLAPVWVTTGALPDGGASSYSYQLVANDDSGDAPTYTLATGSLPGGLSLSSSGLISGTPNASGNFNFTVNATDVNGRSTTSSTLSINVSLAVSLSFDAYGAAGSSWNGSPGAGGRIYGTLQLTPGQTYYYYVGEQAPGYTGGDRYAGGGGGFTAIWTGSAAPCVGTWIIGAGGGGGQNAGNTGGSSYAGGAGGVTTVTQSTAKAGGAGGDGYAGGSAGGAGGWGGGGGGNGPGDNAGGGGGGGYGIPAGSGNTSQGYTSQRGGNGGGGGGASGGGGGNPYRGDPAGGGGGGYVGGRGGSPGSYASLGGYNYYHTGFTSGITSVAGANGGGGSLTVSGRFSASYSGSVGSFVA